MGGGGASCSAATDCAVLSGINIIIDRKKGRFLRLCCRKTGVRANKSDTLYCVFTYFWDMFSFQTVVPQEEAEDEILQNKSYLKSYRRFSGGSGTCHDGDMKIEMTGWDGGVVRG